MRERGKRRDRDERRQGFERRTIREERRIRRRGVRGDRDEGSGMREERRGISFTYINYIYSS